MNYLLDTHTFIFSVFDSPKLGKKARQLIIDAANEISVSVVSFWEISLKYALGKLELTGITPEEMPAVCEDIGFTIIELPALEAASFHQLPRFRHKDPFDRMLIWQAISRKLTLISKDPDFGEYAELGLRVVY